jgi:large subunit ribosomal protein L22
MESLAMLKFARISPRKVRLVADTVRGKDVSEAIEQLKYMQKKSAPILGRLIWSAVNNAKVLKESVDPDRLFIKTILVDGGPTLRRWRPRAHGRATRIRRRTSHIKVVLDERD